MKLLTALAIFALASCAAPDSWEFSPNPLDTPDVQLTTPEAEGRFGHSNKGITW